MTDLENEIVTEGLIVDIAISELAPMLDLARDYAQQVRRAWNDLCEAQSMYNFYTQQLTKQKQAIALKIEQTISKKCTE